MKTQKQIIGDLGEGIACNYLQNKGFSIVDMNYWKPWGEIDIVAQKGDMLHFVEVKTVSREIFDNVACETSGLYNNGVNHETFLDSLKNLFKRKNTGYFFTGISKRDEKQKQEDLEEIKKIKDKNGRYRAEDNLHQWKLKRLSRVFQSFLMEKVSGETRPNFFSKEKKFDGGQALEWQFDVIIVHLDIDTKMAKVEYLDDMII